MKSCLNCLNCGGKEETDKRRKERITYVKMYWSILLFWGHNLSHQRQIIEKLDRQMQALESVRFLKAEAEKRIEEILAGVWGEE